MQTIFNTPLSLFLKKVKIIRDFLVIFQFWQKWLFSTPVSVNQSVKATKFACEFDKMYEKEAILVRLKTCLSNSKTEILNKDSSLRALKKVVLKIDIFDDLTFNLNNIKIKENESEQKKQLHGLHVKIGNL